MKCWFALAAFYLLHRCISQGGSIGNPVFVQKGNNLLLTINKSLTQNNFSLLSWKLNSSNNIVIYSKPGKPQIYGQNIIFSKQNCSLLLENVQKSQSGEYTAVLSGQEDKIIAKHHVTVLDPVLPVNLTVDTVSRSSVSCRFTVTCRMQDSHINNTVRCFYQNCSLGEGTISEITTSGSILKLYLLDDTVICNHSNHVSWKNGLKKIDFCHESRPDIQSLVIVLVFVFLGIIIIPALYYLRKRIKGKCCNTSSKSQSGS